MRPRSHRRALAALFYVGAVFAVGGYLLTRLLAFEGEVIVARGQTERLAVRPASPTLSFAAMQRNAPPEALLFDHPHAARWLNQDAYYDAAQLPFRLAWRGAEIIEQPPAQHSLEWRYADDPRRIAITPNDIVRFEEGTLEVLDARPWGGLLRHPGGEPMANAAIRLGPGAEWRENLLLNAGAWFSVGDVAALRFDWFPDEASARAALPETLPGIESARWGVAEGGAVHWFQGFTPGMGVTLADGAALTLEAYAPDRDGAPAIRVRIERPGAPPETRWAPPNAADETHPIRFEFPAMRPFVAWIHAWRDGAAWARAFRNGEALASTRLEVGVVWPSGEAETALRLDAVLAAALPVTPGEDGPWEARLRDPDAPEALMRLREGEAMRWREGLLRYERVPAPSKMRYTLRADSGVDGAGRDITLGPGDAVRVQGWRLRQSVNNPDPENLALIEARRRPLGPAQWLGLALMTIGGLGWALLWSRGPL